MTPAAPPGRGALIPTSASRDRRWFLLSLAAFAIALCVVAAHHEMWGDELQHWSIAQVSRDPLDLLHNLRYESTPALWHLALLPVTRIARDPLAMQALHVAIALAAVSVFLVAAPFSRLQKTLFAFGYFPLYEYGAISRNYVLGELFLFAFLASFPWQGRRAVAAGLFLLLLAQTSFFGFLLALAGLAALAVDHHEPGRPRDPATALAAAIAILGLMASFAQFRQHPDSAIHQAWDFINGPQALRAAATPWRALVPIPAPQLEFWNTNILDSFANLDDAPPASAGLLLQDALSLALVLVTLAALRRHPRALALYATATLACVAFFYVKKLGYQRHHGTLFLAWIGALWLFAARPNRNDFSAQHGHDRVVSAALTAVLAAHVLAGAYACVVELRFPFSLEKATADWIRTHAPPDTTLAVGAPSIPAFLDRDAYLIPNDLFGRFLLFREPWRTYDLQGIVRLARSLESRYGRPCIVVTFSSFFAESDSQIRAAGLERLTGKADSIIIDFAAYALIPAEQLGQDRPASP